jgi:hypothetical protein
MCHRGDLNAPHIGSTQSMLADFEAVEPFKKIAMHVLP